MNGKIRHWKIDDAKSPSPYGLPFYTALGFVPTGKEQTVNGIRFTLMIYYGSDK